MPADWANVPDVELEGELQDFQTAEHGRLRAAKEFPPTPGMIERAKARARDAFVKATTRIARDAGAHEAALEDVLSLVDAEGVTIASLPTVIDELRTRKPHWFNAHVRPRRANGTFAGWGDLNDRELATNVREKFGFEVVS